MIRPFDDELLSAYLDDELSSDERRLVEDRLATSAADREVLDELQALRGELRSLPATGASDGFADRVVAAAIAAKGHNTQVVVTPAGTAPAAANRVNRRHWSYWAGGVALAIAACVVLIVGPWRENPTIEGGSNVATLPSLADQLVAQLRSAAPAEGEAVVVRLRVSAKAPLGQSLDMALAEAGILQRSAADTASGAIQVGAAYRQQVLEKLGVTQPGPPSPELLETTVEAAEAVFVEASLTQLEQVIASLSTEPSRALQLAAEAKLAVALPQIEPGTAEGEDGSGNAKSAGKGRNFSQRLNAGMFRLEKRELSSSQPTAVNTAAVAPTAPVRVLILVEQVD